MDRKQQYTYGMYTMGNMPATGVTACDCPEGFACYVIQEGETLLGIARKIGIPLRQLLQFNPGLNPYYYRAGDMLCVPEERGTCLNGRMYIVVRGDTLFSVGERFGVSVDDMIAANPHVNPNRLNIGQVICIPSAAPAAPAQPEQPPETVVPPFCAEPFETVPTPMPEPVPEETPMPEPAPTPIYPALPTVPQPTATDAETCMNVEAAAAQEHTHGIPTEKAETNAAGHATDSAGDSILINAEKASAEITQADTADITEAPSSERKEPVWQSLAAVPCAPNNNPYVIQANETLMDILLRNNLSFGAVREANPTAELLTLSPGDAVCIPPESTTGGCMPGAGAYVIMLGDTLATLADKFEVTMLEIMVNNPLMSPGDFLVGRVICMPVR